MQKNVASKGVRFLNKGQRVTWGRNLTVWDDCELIGTVECLGTAYHYGSVRFKCPSAPCGTVFVPIKQNSFGYWMAYVIWPVFPAGMYYNTTC